MAWASARLRQRASLKASAAVNPGKTIASASRNSRTRHWCALFLPTSRFRTPRRRPPPWSPAGMPMTARFRCHPSLAYNESDAKVVADHSLQTLLEQAEARGLATGIVTTTSITDATPAANYAHTPNRNWQYAGQLPPTATLADIAMQLVMHQKNGDGLEVVLGGGRDVMTDTATPDPEYPARTGKRKDGRNLINEWLAAQRGSQYVWKRDDLLAVDPKAHAAPAGAVRAHQHALRGGPRQGRGGRTVAGRDDPQGHRDAQRRTARVSTWSWRAAASTMRITLAMPIGRSPIPSPFPTPCARLRP